MAGSATRERGQGARYDGKRRLEAWLPPRGRASSGGDAHVVLDLCPTAGPGAERRTRAGAGVNDPWAGNDYPIDLWRNAEGQHGGRPLRPPAALLSALRRGTGRRPAPPVRFGERSPLPAWARDVVLALAETSPALTRALGVVGASHPPAHRRRRRPGLPRRTAARREAAAVAAAVRRVRGDPHPSDPGGYGRPDRRLAAEPQRRAPAVPAPRLDRPRPWTGPGG